MARQNRVAVGEVVYHVINRANGRTRIFASPNEYRHFESLLIEGVKLAGMRLLAYVIMPNHWHLVLYPKKNGDMSEFMRWITTTHVRQRRVATKSIGHGHLYQGTYKSFPIQEDKHLHDVIRYVEQNPLRAKLCKRAEQWHWSSLFRRRRGNKEDRELLADLPSELPRNYLSSVNTLLHEQHLKTIRHSIAKGAPYGSDQWTERMVERYRMEGTQRGPGRPKMT
ncbi:MAG: transposase [Candidatus Kaiserbacteria bacterium]|nr:MAG: transposase [Candidatus Kaiserbacteria bacterium]